MNATSKRIVKDLLEMALRYVEAANPNLQAAIEAVIGIIEGL